jgi:hypothetical protein
VDNLFFAVYLDDKIKYGEVGRAGLGEVNKRVQGFRLENLEVGCVRCSAHLKVSKGVSITRKYGVRL